MLNRGKENVGDSVTPRYVSYGTQSPTADAVPLAWLAGDVRYNMGGDASLIGWKCISPGTPGTWQEMRLGEDYFNLKLSYGKQNGDGTLPTPAEQSPSFYLRPNTDATVIQATAGTPGAIWEYEMNIDAAILVPQITIVVFVYSCILVASGGAAPTLTLGVTVDGVATAATTGNLDGLANARRAALETHGSAITNVDRIGILCATTGVGSGFLMATAVGEIRPT